MWDYFRKRLGLVTLTSQVEALTPVESEEKLLVSKKVVSNLPARRISKKDNPLNAEHHIKKATKFLTPEYQFDAIPLIRKLTISNPDIGQAFSDIVKLANSGHNILFDPEVSPEQQDKMRKYLMDESKTWVEGTINMDGIVNKMFSQLMIAGAIANEAYPSMDLDRLEGIAFLYPERIRYKAKRGQSKYEPYQKITNRDILQRISSDTEYIKLNPNTFKYIALNGDTDLPYGIPPYLTSFDPVARQKSMLDNIDNVVNLAGLMGYIEFLVAKPDQHDGESEEKYKARLERFLDEAKERAQLGLKDGINVGYLDDHEFDFKQTTKSADGIATIFQENEQQMSSALKYDSAFMGRSYAASESLVTILFTKMIAQLSQMQDIAKGNLEWIYNLALSFGGFEYDYLKVEFKRTTITDDLKYQQAQEILLRNLMVLFDQGIISQEQFADQAGYIKPDQKEPRVSREAIDPSLDPQAREKGKDASDRKVRDKDNPQGTIKRKGQSNNVLFNN